MIPIVQKTQVGSAKPQALILCPTRELCDQVLRECRKFSKYLPNFKSVALVGGQAEAPQIEALRQGVHLIVGTPGRTLEHFNNDRVKSDQLKILVLDEADRLLEEGFAEEMQAIISKLPRQRQTIFFSATFPESMEEFSRLYQKNAQESRDHPRSRRNSQYSAVSLSVRKTAKSETLTFTL